jgi:hypothetical protein
MPVNNRFLFHLGNSSPCVYNIKYYSLPILFENPHNTLIQINISSFRSVATKVVTACLSDASRSGNVLPT